MLIEKINSKDFFGREIILISVSKIEAFDLKKLPRLANYFTLFIVNNNEVFVDQYGKKAKELINSGLAYLCAWGVDCEKIHDVIDEVDVMMGIDKKIESDDKNVIMTNWHHNETIKEALYYFLNTTAPTEKYYSECKNSLVLVIGDSSESNNIQEYLENQNLLDE